MNIRTCLILLALLSTLWPAGLIGVRLIQDRAENVAVAMKNLEEASNGISSRIDNRIQGTTQLLYGLARAKDLDTNDKMACSSFLSNVREAYPQYTGILTITPDGQLFCDSLLTDRRLDLRDRGYFKEALVSRDRVVLAPVFGKLTGIAVLQMITAMVSSMGFCSLAPPPQTLKDITVSSVSARAALMKVETRSADNRIDLIGMAILRA